MSQSVNYTFVKPKGVKATDIFPEHLTLTFSLDNNNIRITQGARDSRFGAFVESRGFGRLYDRLAF